MKTHKKLDTRTCPVCDTVFETNHRLKTYCGQTCRLEINRQRAQRARDEDGRGRPLVGVATEVTCKRCGIVFSYQHVPSRIQPRKYCSKQCYTESLRGKSYGTPRGLQSNRMTEAEITAIQLIWHAYDLPSPQSFFDETNLHIVYGRDYNRSLIHEWTIYTIIFQSHLMFRYETVIQLPGLDARAFHSVCDRFKLRLMDSEQFDRDRQQWLSAEG